MTRVYWGSIAAVTLTVAAVVAAVLEARTLAVALGLSSITWAILSLKERQ